MKTDILSGYVQKFNENDDEQTKQLIDNDHTLDWMRSHVPVFECPDKTIEETYYFRWWVLRKHIKQTPEGMIFTEFLPDVPWAGPYNSINSASGHHISEARWLRGGKKYIDDYIRFWFRGSGNVYSYSSWIVNAVYEYCLLTGDFGIACELLQDFVAFYEKIEKTHKTKFGLFWSHDDRDAMEKSISGNGLRPTLNSYMYANACAVSKIAAHADDIKLSELFAKKASTLYENINRYLWDETAGFYKVIPLESKDSETIEFDFGKIPLSKNVREEIGYIPWYFDLAEKDKDIAFKYLLDINHFGADFGPLTAERVHPDTLKPDPSHECLWNGPSWPFATTQTINSIIKMLKQRDCAYFDKTDFMKLIKTYSSCHYRINEDGVRINWLDENLDPDSGEWLSRKILKEAGWPEHKAGYERGKDYNHSGFCDLIIRGLCGIDINENNEINIDPLLLQDMWDYFFIDGLPYKNHIIKVIYDSKGTRYNKGKGLMLYVDGKLAGQADIIKKLNVNMVL